MSATDAIKSEEHAFVKTRIFGKLRTRRRDRDGMEVACVDGGVVGSVGACRSFG